MSTSTNNVGILAMEVYFPNVYVKQEDLETANNVSKGKYTIGLGQESMAFTGDAEDINSVALTVVHSLLEKYSISPLEVGRLEIGTESLIDKSKSTKTVLMRLFAESGNTDVEGATVVNACYGGTGALLNALAWVDSSSWDGRFAIVVAADIAVYANGPARPTGGCGAVAMLIGRNAPVQIDLTTRCTHASDTWDFFKPNMDSEYPVVNGSVSQNCYLQALDDVYTRFIAKTKRVTGRAVTVADTDYFLVHSPYNKLTQKALARMVYRDMLAGAVDSEPIAKWLEVSPEQTYDDKDLEAALKNVAGPLYKQKLALPCEISRQLGNTYTASVYLNLAYLVSMQGAGLVGKSLVLYSYGSGALATMLRVVAHDGAVNTRFSLQQMQQTLQLTERLNNRVCLTPADLTVALTARETSHSCTLPFHPTFSTETLAVGAYHLVEVSVNHERIYQRKTAAAAI